MTHIIKNEEQASKSGWTPYDNKKVKGFPIMTIIRGNKVMHNGELVEQGTHSALIEKSERYAALYKQQNE